MTFHLSLLHLLTLLTQATTHLILPTTNSSSSAPFPLCALTCPLLLEAETACTPPQFPVASQLTYDSCFCQHDTLQGLYTSSDAVCGDDVCGVVSERVELQVWFVGWCGMVVQGVDPAATAAIVNVSATAGVGGAATQVPVGGEGGEGVGGFGLTPGYIALIVLVVLLMVCGAVGVGVWRSLRRRRGYAEVQMSERRGSSAAVANWSDSKSELPTFPSPLWSPSFERGVFEKRAWEKSELM